MILTNPQDGDVLSRQGDKWVNQPVSGLAGASGISGYSGAKGVSGFSGYSGVNGLNGATGATGSTGATGAQGQSGASGYSGFSGASGLNGGAGASGVSGYSGLSGYSGFSGVTGSSGATGSAAVVSALGTAPLTLGYNSGTQTITGSIAAATTSMAGLLSAAHYTLLNNATATNTANTIVERDSSGSISAAGGTIAHATFIPNWDSSGTDVWIDMPTGGPSAIGSGGAGGNAWLAYAHDNGQFFADALAGDICYRNTSGQLLFGVNGSGSSLLLDTSGNASFKGYVKGDKYKTCCIATCSYASIGSHGFYTLPLIKTFDPGTHFNDSTHVYTCPVNGFYEIVTNLRLVSTNDDGAPEPGDGFGQGAGTSNGDGSHFVWFQTNNYRNGCQVTRRANFTAGDQIRMYAYCDYSPASGDDPAVLSAEMTINLVAMA